MNSNLYNKIMESVSKELKEILEIETTAPEYLYHATPATNLRSIKKLGLGAKTSKKLWDYSDTKYDKYSTGIFLADSAEQAESFVETSEAYDELCDNREEDVDILIFKIKTDKLDLNKLEIDENNSDEECQTYFYNGIINYTDLEKTSIYECDGGCDCGMVGDACFNTGANTMGMGDVVPAGFHTLGSGDRFDYFPFMFMSVNGGKKRKAKKKKAKVFSKK